MSAPSLRVLFLSLVALPAQASSLDEAQQQVKDLQFAKASRTLKKVATERSLARADVLRYQELAGVVAASLGDAKGARAAFARLLVLAPDFALKGRFAPKVTTPFFEAKAEAKEGGALTLAVGEPRFEGEQVVALEVQSDGARGWLKKVVALVDEDGVRREVALQPGRAPLAVRGRRVTVALTARDALEWELGAEPARVFEAPAPPAPPPPAAASPVAPPPSPPLAVAPALVAAPPPPVGSSPPAARAALKPARPEYRFRGLALGLGVTGALGLATGALGTVLLLDARREFEALTPDADGVVREVTRVEALGLDEQARIGGWLLSIGFPVGGAFALAGLITLLAETPVQPQLALMPGGGLWLAVGGALP